MDRLSIQRQRRDLRVSTTGRPTMWKELGLWCAQGQYGVRGIGATQADAWRCLQANLNPRVSPVSIALL